MNQELRDLAQTLLDSGWDALAPRDQRVLHAARPPEQGAVGLPMHEASQDAMGWQGVDRFRIHGFGFPK